MSREPSYVTRLRAAMQGNAKAQTALRQVSAAARPGGPTRQAADLGVKAMSEICAVANALVLDHGLDQIRLRQLTEQVATLESVLAQRDALIQTLHDDGEFVAHVFGRVRKLVDRLEAASVVETVGAEDPLEELTLVERGVDALLTKLARAERVIEEAEDATAELRAALNAYYYGGTPAEEGQDATAR